jgi:predicted nucleic acid-binding protein
MENDPLAVKKAKDIEKGGQTLSVGAPTIFELYVGLSLSKKPEEETRKIAEVLSALPQYPLDFASASSGGVIFGMKMRAGFKMDPEDAMIAGIARTYKEKIVTRNVKHFTGIDGVSVETY